MKKKQKLKKRKIGHFIIKHNIDNLLLVRNRGGL